MQSTKTNDFKSLVYGLHILALMDLRTNHNTGNYAPTLGKQKDGFTVTVREDSIVGEFADTATVEESTISI